MSATETEWGVRWELDGRVRLDNYSYTLLDGSNAQQRARQAVESYNVVPNPMQRVTLIARQVTYGPWEEVTNMIDDPEAQEAEAAQEAAEGSQDSGGQDGDGDAAEIAASDDSEPF